MQVNLDELAYVSETALTIRGSRRRTTVPKTIVEALGMKDGDRLRWVLFKDGRIVLVHVGTRR
jgi:bifunctional DNA-binding transcriptional regulator/antitoxin component of YhaV-PrlF toxin-antitoxin module